MLSRAIVVAFDGGNLRVFASSYQRLSGLSYKIPCIGEEGGILDELALRKTYVKKITLINESTPRCRGFSSYTEQKSVDMFGILI